MSTPDSAQRPDGRRAGRRRGRAEELMVPDATFTSYYGRPVVKASPWEAEIPAYLFAGGGGIFGGGERTHLVAVPRLPGPAGGPLDFSESRTRSGDSETKAIGQFGGGIEVRLTPHIGWTNDFSWNVVDGPNNNFGMVRTGVNFAF